MANINSLMSSGSSSTSSLYGTRNVLSGLASGMDTEAMIENSVSGYKSKITQLQQQQTKYEWKQDAYRGISDKLYELSQKYTSYTSKTNLFSNAFFDNSIATTPVGTAADMLSATGRSSSNVQILAAQSATAASYSVKASALDLTMPSLTTENVIRSGNDIAVGQLKGSFTLNYDGQTVEITFDETDIGINDFDEDGELRPGGKTLQKAIQDKLNELTINTNNGVKKAGDVIQVNVDRVYAGTNSDGDPVYRETIGFSENAANSNQGAVPYISAIDASLKSPLGVTEGKLYEGSSTTKYTLYNEKTSFTKNQSVQNYLEGRTINVTVDGVEKSFQLKNLASDRNGVTMASLQQAFKDGFESVGANIDVQVDETGNKLVFSPPNRTSTVAISAADDEANRLLGLSNGVGNYVSDKTSISALLGSKFSFARSEPAVIPANVTLTKVTGGGNIYEDKDGNRYEKVVDADDNETYYRVNSKNERLFELTINNKSVYVSAKDSLDSVLETINNSDMGVKAAYSKLTGSFTFSTKEAGAGSAINFDNPLAQALFGKDPTRMTLKDIFGDDIGDDPVTLKFYQNMVSDSNGNVTFNANSTIADVLKSINSNKDNGNAVRTYVKYDAATGQFLRASKSNTVYDPVTNQFTDKEGVVDVWQPIPSGWDLTIDDGQGNVASRQPSDFFQRGTPSSFTAGTDAQIRALVNGEGVTLQRSTNSFDLDGMTVTLKGNIGSMDAYLNAGNNDAALKSLDETNKADAISFTTSGGSEDIIKTIREFVDEYNAAMKQVYDAFATQPAEKNSSTHTKYEPLSDDDKADMSEKAIENYETKAKQGILFGDSDLRGLYQSMLSAISPGGSDGAALRDMGIETTYSGGLTQIKLNETKLRDALETDPDKVRNAFTKAKDTGATSDGLMSNIKKALDKYASASIATPGILVKKAGSTFSSTSLLSNAVQKQIDSVQEQIEKWQSKMSSKIDYYTRQFTTLEKLMNTMNSQSSALAGLMGGY